jgi:hypothetical protein
MSKPNSPQTIAASNGVAGDAAFGAVTPPLYLTSTFASMVSSAREPTPIPDRPTPPATCWLTPWPNWKAGQGPW